MDTYGQVLREHLIFYFLSCQRVRQRFQLNARVPESLLNLGADLPSLLEVHLLGGEE